MNEQIKRYQNIDKRLAEFHYRLSGERKYEGELLLPSSAVRLELETQLKELKAEVDSLAVWDRPSSIWKEHLQDFIGEENMSLKNMFDKPAGFIVSITWVITNVFRLDARPDRFRIKLLEKKVNQLPAIIDTIKKEKHLLTDSAKKEIIEWCEGDAQVIGDIIPKIPVYFHSASFTEEDKEKLIDILQKVQNMLQICASFDWEISKKEEHLKKNEEQRNDNENAAEEDDELICKFEESYYRAVLSDMLGVELDELLSWYEREIQQTREEVFRIARSLAIEENNPATMKEVTDILFKYAGPYDTIEEMFQKGREYLDLAQEAAHKYVWFPEDEYCNLAKVPESIKFSYPWGGYEGVDIKRRPITGQFFLNDYNYKAVTDGWIKMMAVHEAYPGHHVQYVREITDTIPETAKIGSKYIPLLEGTAHRSEKVFEFIYPEDPFYPLFVAYRRHHTAVRVKADLMLRYFGRPIKEIAQLYMDELGFDKNTARGQIKAQETMEGYFTCYYYGLKKLTDWEKKYGYDEKTYTELLFSVGRISMSNFEKFLQLTPEEKRSFTHDYASLLMEEKDYINPFVFEK